MDTQLNEPTYHDSIKVPKVIKQTSKKCYYKTLRTSVINSPMPLPFPPWEKQLYAHDDSILDVNETGETDGEHTGPRES